VCPVDADAALGQHTRDGRVDAVAGLAAGAADDDAVAAVVLREPSTGHRPAGVVDAAEQHDRLPARTRSTGLASSVMTALL
jgi:hypothetical protein